MNARPTRVVFLDIDGVLNHARLYAKHNDRKSPTEPVDWLDRDCVKRVNALCARTGAAVVISSSWRRTLGVDPTSYALRTAGLTALVVGATPEHGAPGPNESIVNERWSEIRAWLDDHPEVLGWVVLDDADLDGVPRERFVQTRLAEGLTDADVERAAEILGPALSNDLAYLAGSVAGYHTNYDANLGAAPAPLASVSDFYADGARFVAYAANAWPAGVARCPHCRRRIALYERRDGSLCLRLHHTLPSAEVDGEVRLQGSRCPMSMREPHATTGGGPSPGGGRTPTARAAASTRGGSRAPSVWTGACARAPTGRARGC